MAYKDIKTLLDDGLRLKNTLVQPVTVEIRSLADISAMNPTGTEEYRINI